MFPTLGTHGTMATAHENIWGAHSAAGAAARAQVAETARSGGVVKKGSPLKVAAAPGMRYRVVSASIVADAGSKDRTILYCAVDGQK